MVHGYMHLQAKRGKYFLPHESTKDAGSGEEPEAEVINIVPKTDW